jgi:hypothetical protein
MNNVFALSKVILTILLIGIFVFLKKDKNLITLKKVVKVEFWCGFVNVTLLLRGDLSLDSVGRCTLREWIKI